MSFCWLCFWGLAGVFISVIGNHSKSISRRFAWWDSDMKKRQTKMSLNIFQRFAWGWYLTLAMHMSLLSTKNPRKWWVCINGSQLFLRLVSGISQFRWLNSPATIWDQLLYGSILGWITVVDYHWSGSTWLLDKMHTDQYSKWPNMFVLKTLEQVGGCGWYCTEVRKPWWVVS